MAVVTVLFVAYLLSDDLRNLLISLNIDANYVLGFVALITVLVTINENVKNRRLSFNISLHNKVEERSLIVLGKLLRMSSKSRMMLETQHRYKKAIAAKQLYSDENNILSKEDVEKDLELVIAIVQTHFPDVHEDWNELQKLMTTTATNTANIVKNYNANIVLIQSGQTFSNHALDKIDELIMQSSEANAKIERLSNSIADKVMKPVIENSKKLKESF